MKKALWHVIPHMLSPVILSAAKNLWQPASLEGGRQILRGAQNDMALPVSHS